MTFRAVFFLCAAIAACALMGGRSEAAPSRCNLRNVGDVEAAMQRIEHDTKATADQRGAALNRQLSLLTQERQILAEACTENDGASVLGHVDVVAAQIEAQNARYALDSYQPRCPAGASAIAAGFVAAGWSALGQTRRTLLYEPAGEPGRDQVTAKLRALADTVKLTLPELPEATDFWVQSIQQKGQAVAEACTPKM